MARAGVDPETALALSSDFASGRDIPLGFAAKLNTKTPVAKNAKATRKRALTTLDSRRGFFRTIALFVTLDYGRAVPDLDFTVEISELLIKPLTVTSVRKLLELATVPLCALVWLMSELLTDLLAVVSPKSTLIGTTTLAEPVPS